eukprot:scaffold64190_cov32-Tisochrysis_lutea.AAC.5
MEEGKRDAGRVIVSESEICGEAGDGVRLAPTGSCSRRTDWPAAFPRGRRCESLRAHLGSRLWRGREPDPRLL